MKRMTRIERMRQIVRCVEALTRWHVATDRDGYYLGMSMRQIAKAIYLSPSSHMMGLLDSCVTAGWLEYQIHAYRVGVPARYYHVTDLGRDMVREMREVL